jgi:glycerophosphoryl diester phosphodiesterase
MPKIMSVAHRGFSSSAPENTLAAYVMAIEHSPDFVECDVRRTKDRKIIICHDAAVDRTTNGSGKIADMTLAELRELDAGSWFGPQFAGEKLPTLEEYLDLLKGKCGPQIELKEEGLEEDVVAMIQERGMSDETMIISFHYAVGLRVLKGIGHPAGEEEAVRLADEAASVNADIFAVNYRDITPALVRATHAANVKMAGWTIDSPDDMRAWAEMGLDFITSNDIVLLHKVLAQIGVREA